MNVLPLEEFRKFEKDFFEKYNKYIDLRTAVYTSDIPEGTQDSIVDALEKAFEGYTDMYSRSEMTWVTPEYFGFKEGETNHWLKLNEHIGEECESEGVKGTFVGTVATIEDYYYVINTGEKMELMTGVAKIKFGIS